MIGSLLLYRQKKNHILKKTCCSLLCLILFILLLIFGLDSWVSYKTSPYIYTDIKTVPKRAVGVVLGTAKYIRGGGYNEFYKQRILGAAALYFDNKIDILLLSGDNATSNYNEPITMQQDFLKRGIPESSIHLDYAGFRTLDSIIRASKVFDVQNFTIITQKFHCERAVFIAQYQNISAQCYAVPSPKKMKIVRLREMFARISTFIDLYILHKKPKYLGPILPITNLE